MQQNKYLLIIFSILSLASCNTGKDIDIYFDDGFIYSAQSTLVSELKKVSYRKEIKETLLEQDWIKDFRVNFRLNGDIKIIISTKKPVFIWNDKYYIDSEIQSFNFDNNNTNLVHVFCPSNQLNEAMKIVKFINTEMSPEKISFNKLDFKYSSGWTLISDNNIHIRFGKNITKERFNSFQKSLNYVFAKRSLPSMIDLRYKDGIAINYGK
jgi:cell division septal protein FtsQ